MGYPKRNDSRRDSRHSGSKPYSRPSGGFKSRDNNRDSYDRSDRPIELHQADCADCGKSCEVPFKPNGRKPVYCRDCFRNHDQESGRPSYRPTQSREPYGSSNYDRPSTARATVFSAPAATAADVAKLSQKLDKILEILENHLEDVDDEDDEEDI